MYAPRRRLLMLACTLAAALADGPAVASGEPAAFTVLGSGFTGEPFPLGGDLVAESDSLVVTIRDVGDPLRPRVLGWLDHAADCYWSQIVADGPLLIGLTGDVSAGVVGFSVVDFADPLAPVDHGVISGMPFDSGWLRGRALLATAGGLLVTYDLADLGAPAVTGFVPLGSHAGPRWPAAVANTLYLVDHGATLRALDVEDTLHPATLGLPSLAGDRIDAMVAGEGVLYLMIAADVGGPGERVELVTCDVGAPAQPVETSRLTLFKATGAAGRALARQGDLLVAAGSDGQVRAFGLADAAHPSSGWTRAHAATRLVVTYGAVLAREGRDLLTFARTAWDVPPPAPERRSPLPLLRTVVGEGPLQLAQYCCSPHRLATVDVSNPYRPLLGPPIPFPAGGGLLQYAGGVGLSTTDGAQLLDLADPAHPVARGMLLWLDGRPVWRLWTRNLVTMENPTSGAAVWLFDIGDLDHPGVWGHVPEMMAFGADDGLLVAGDEHGARLYDIRNLEAPVRVGALADPGAVVRAAIGDGHLYTSTVRNGKCCLETWVLADGASPRWTASAILPAAATHLDRLGSRLCAHYESGAVIFNLGDPGLPVPIGAPLRFNTRHHAFAVNGDVVTLTPDLVTVRNDGLPPAPAPLPAAAVAVTLSPAWPNPCNPATALAFTLDAERELTLSVYDIRGRHVADVARGRFGAGTHEVTWNGTDADGAAVATGVYLLRLHGRGVEAATTVTLMK